MDWHRMRINNNKGGESLPLTTEQNMTNQIQLTNQSLKVFIACAKEAHNWSGEPFVCMIDINLKSDRGNLADLVKKGLIEIHDYEAVFRPQDMYIRFTESGILLANSHGIYCDDWNQ